MANPNSGLDGERFGGCLLSFPQSRPVSCDPMVSVLPPFSGHVLRPGYAGMQGWRGLVLHLFLKVNPPTLMAPLVPFQAPVALPSRVRDLLGLDTALPYALALFLLGEGSADAPRFPTGVHALLLLDVFLFRKHDSTVLHLTSSHSSGSEEEGHGGPQRTSPW